MLRSALSRAMVEEAKRERALQVEQEQAKAVEEAAAQDHAAAAKAAARPRNPNSPFERVRALLRELGEPECGDDEDPFEHYLEMMKAELREETRQLREVNDEDATRLSSPVEINAIMREWSRTSDRRIARRLETKVTTSLDERLEAVKLENKHPCMELCIKDLQFHLSSTRLAGGLSTTNRGARNAAGLVDGRERESDATAAGSGGSAGRE